MTESSMQLPPGKTCGDCVHIRRCKTLFGCKDSNVICDFAPSRFKAAYQHCPGFSARREGGVIHCSNPNCTAN